MTESGRVPSISPHLRAPRLFLALTSVVVSGVQLEHFERPLNDDPIRHVLVAHGFLGEKQAFESDGFHRDAVEFESFLDALSRLRCCRDEHIDIGGRTSPRCYLNLYFTEVSPIIGNPGKQGLSPNSDRFCYPIVTRIDTQYRSCNYIQFDGQGKAHMGITRRMTLALSSRS